ncbi:glycosyltransferase [Azonexus sp. IMCC34842]|uniref:glycosyltransferase n=1 Tax=Azonexus sp. IMCC34842 TaxID=3420950 RepID=UPI003D0CA515
MISGLERKWFKRLLAVDLLLLAIVIGWVLAQAVPSSEAVRLRNALLYQGVESAATLNWSPENAPADFRRETQPPLPTFASVIAQMGLQSEPDTWQRTLSVARHLQMRLGDGGPIMSGLEDSYRRITQSGEGYCGDFSDVFTGLAQAAGIETRLWSFSFDGYGGHGHIFNEVWDPASGHWRAIDVFNNYLFVDAITREPLSALELRAALRGERGAFEIVPLNPKARPGYVHIEKAYDYFRRGQSEWYLWWGNNVVSVDRNVWVRGAGAISRHLEQLAGIVVGIEPGLRIIATPESTPRIAALASLQSAIKTAVVLALVLLLLAAWLFWQWRKAPREDWGMADSQPLEADVSMPRITVVGPIPPPSGGMANQCRQLVRLLRDDGVPVEQVQTNAPYQPAWVADIPVLRAAFRLIPYALALWRAAGRNQVIHIFANSGWAWHLFAAPAIVIARWRGVPVIVNYRGGNADPFLKSAPRYVQRMLGDAAALVTPSGFLQEVFAKYDLSAHIVPNIVDLQRFSPEGRQLVAGSPHLIVTRNLEPIYDIPTAIRCFALVRKEYPEARLTVAGTGPEQAACESLVEELGLSGATRFAGRIDNDSIASLYACADIALNPSTVDNMPISILEAYASGVPVVTTDVGGIPFMAKHEQSALLVPPNDPQAMAAAVLRLLAESTLADRLTTEGIKQAQAYAWSKVRDQWMDLYRAVAASRKVFGKTS